MTVDSLIEAGCKQLAQAGIADASLDARLLFQHLTAMSRSEIVLNGNRLVDDSTSEAYYRLIARRCTRTPLQYLTGSREFWSLDFLVTPDVLIPRPETEFLLERALASCSGRTIHRALDLCTGSGVIGVVLAKELGCCVDAVDISPSALMVAAENIIRHQVGLQVSLICSDLFSALHRKKSYDLIVSNPPYIADDQLERLEPEVSQAEPRLALSGGASGLEIIARIAAEAGCYLRPDGCLFVEIGSDQEAGATVLFTAAKEQYGQVRVINDWSGRPRVLQAQCAG